MPRVIIGRHWAAKGPRLPAGVKRAKAAKAAKTAKVKVKRGKR